MSASMDRPPLVFAVILLRVTRGATLTTFVFSELKAKKNQALLQRISRKIHKEPKEKLEKLFNTAHLFAKENLAMAKFTILSDPRCVYMTWRGIKKCKVQQKSK